ncbi:MAG: hypothetical protein K2X08_00295, partial [Chlamydiales bacterium]|nr:hypothetical protein [Chlamydiales bacterium]
MSAIHPLRSAEIRQVLEDKQASIGQKRGALVAVAENPENFENIDFRVLKVATLLLSAQATLSPGTNPTKTSLQELSVYVGVINSIEGYQQNILEQQKVKNLELSKNIESLKSDKEQSSLKLSELDNKVIELEEGVKELEKMIARLENENTQERLVSENHVAQLNRYLESAQKECVQLRREREDAAKDLTENFEIQKLLLTQAFLTDHANKINELDRDHQQELVKLREETSQLADEKRRLNKANRGLKAENAKLR